MHIHTISKNNLIKNINKSKNTIISKGEIVICIFLTLIINFPLCKLFKNDFIFNKLDILKNNTIYSYFLRKFAVNINVKLSFRN